MTEIKRADNKDLEEISRLIMKEFPYTKATKQKLRKRLRNKNIHLFKLVYRNTMVGFTEIEEAGYLGKINGLGIIEKFRGKKLGKKLVQFAVDYLKGKGAKEIILIVKEENEQAKRLYRQSGFKKAGLLKKKIDGSKIEEMSLQIADEISYVT